MTKRTKLLTACLLVAAASVFALAQVNPGLFVFRSGTPVTADEANANFKLLQDQLEETRGLLATATAALAELKQQVAGFEGQEGPQGRAGPPGRLSKQIVERSGFLPVNSEDTFYLVLGDPVITLSPPPLGQNLILEFMGNNSEAKINFQGYPPRVADSSVPLRNEMTFHKTDGLSTHFRLVWVEEGTYPYLGHWLWATL